MCSLHFLESDYLRTTKQRRLTRTAVPSVFPSYEYLKLTLSTKWRKVELKEPPCSLTKTENSLSVINSGSEENSAPAADCQDKSCIPSALSNPRNVSFSSGLVDSDSGGGTEVKSAAQESQHPAAVKAESAYERNDDIVPCKRSGVKAIKRLRVQLYKKINEIRRLQNGNECLKKETQ